MPANPYLDPNRPLPSWAKHLVPQHKWKDYGPKTMKKAPDQPDELSTLRADLAAAQDSIRKLHDDRSMARQQLAACREGLEYAEGRLIGIAGHPPALDDDWTLEHSIIADIRTTLARVDAMAAGEGEKNAKPA